ncbi:MAG: nucleotidyl transferase AbiEii/AbiGii toxin family protein [Bacilli bacterium]|nr:nucleotidyl transferase AbiEii/AbiGii toxin family protein [Bacilli bacterium]
MNSMQVKDKIRNISNNKNIDFSVLLRSYMYERFIERLAYSKYKTMFDYKFLNLKSYNLETILAEKLETILSKKDLSSRLKDYYDIYLISTSAKDKIDLNVLRNAIDRTFQKRKFNARIKEHFEIIKNSELLLTRWNAYAAKNNIKNLSYEDVINCLEDLIKIIEPVTV